MDVESEFREMCRGMAADELAEIIGRMREAGVAEDIIEAAVGLEEPLRDGGG